MNPLKDVRAEWESEKEKRMSRAIITKLNCPRCNAPAFVKLPKAEWKNPKYPIYECASCSYYEERFD